MYKSYILEICIKAEKLLTENIFGHTCKCCQHVHWKENYLACVVKLWRENVALLVFIGAAHTSLNPHPLICWYYSCARTLIYTAPITLRQNATRMGDLWVDSEALKVDSALIRIISKVLEDLGFHWPAPNKLDPSSCNERYLQGSCSHPSCLPSTMSLPRHDDSAIRPEQAIFYSCPHLCWESTEQRVYSNLPLLKEAATLYFCPPSAIGLRASKGVPLKYGQLWTILSLSRSSAPPRTWLYKIPKQGSPYSVLEGRSPADLSFNTNKTHLNKLIEALLGILKASLQVYWDKLELNKGLVTLVLKQWPKWSPGFIFPEAGGDDTRLQLRLMCSIRGPTSHLAPGKLWSSACISTASR